MFLFQFQQKPFGFNASGKSCELPIAAYHAVARHNDADGISAVGGCHCSHGKWIA